MRKAVYTDQGNRKYNVEIVEITERYTEIKLENGLQIVVSHDNNHESVNLIEDLPEIITNGNNIVYRTTTSGILGFTVEKATTYEHGFATCDFRTRITKKYLIQKCRCINI